MLDVGHDAVELYLRDLRALEGVCLERVADHILLRPLLEALDKLVVDAFLHVDTRAGAAALAMVEKDAEVDPGDGIVDVGILEDELGDLPPSSSVTFFKLDPAAAFMILPPTTVDPVKATLSTSMCEAMAAPAVLSEAGDDVNDARRKPASLTRVAATRPERWVCSAVLITTQVAGSNCRSNLPGPHKQREIPGNDLSAHANLPSSNVRPQAPGEKGTARKDLPAPFWCSLKVSGVVSMTLPSILSAQPPE